MKRLAAIAGFLALFTGAASAQVFSSPGDLSGYALSSAIPQPASANPSGEALSSAVGTGTLYARWDHVHPRISRATSVATTTGGVFSGTWSPALASTPNLVLTPIYAGAGNATCFLTATPSTTAFSGKCTTDQSALLSLSIVTTGLTVGPANASSGMTVQVFAIPPTQ